MAFGKLHFKTSITHCNWYGTQQWENVASLWLDYARGYLHGNIIARGADLCFIVRHEDLVLRQEEVVQKLIALGLSARQEEIVLVEEDAKGGGRTRAEIAERMRRSEFCDANGAPFLEDREARRWLSATFDNLPGAQNYADSLGYSVRSD